MRTGLISYVGAPLCAMMFVTLSARAEAQSFVVDLGQHDPGKTDTIAVSPGTTGTVVVSSRLPAKNYSVTTRVRVIPIPPLAKPAGGAGLVATDICAAADTARITERALTAVTAEKEVAGKIDELLALGRACATNPQAIVDIISAETRRLTVEEITSVTIDAGQELEVRVVSDSQVWTVVFSAGPRGSWQTHYGFVFSPNRDQTYFSQAEGSKFRVTRDFASSKEFNFIPSVFFSWMPASRENKSANYSWTGGLGFDQANPAVFGGATVAYNHNIAIVAGVVAQRQKRLASNYNPESLPLLDASLTPAQLSREAYRFNVFVGLAFRFDANPFSAPKKEEPKTGDAKGDKPK